MFRAAILAIVILVAIGMIVPVATEHTEAGAKEQERHELKKTKAEKFRYRTRFRTASYSKSDRFKQTAKLLEPGESRKKPKKKIKTYTNIVDTSAEAAEPAEAPSESSVTSTAPASSYARTRKTRSTSAPKTAARKRTRYRKVSRINSSRAKNRKASSRNYSSKRRTVKKSKRKYTARWWHNYRAQKRQEEALAKRKAAMAARREALQRQHAAAEGYGFVEQSQRYSGAAADPSQELAHFVMNADGNVTMVVVGQAMGDTIDYGRRRTLAGVSTVALRRTVIDQMIRENGWVENDFHKEVDGKKVYVVVAKAPDKKNRVQAKTFYFAEAEGRIYRIAASAPKDTPERAEAESEKMVRTLPRDKRPRTAKNEPAKNEPAVEEPVKEEPAIE